MAIWSGLGMNYGHDVTPGTYDTTQVESDFSFLKSQGVSRLRIVFPTFGFVALTTDCQDMIARALNHGFYVVWGVATGAANGTMTATTWASFKSYVTGTLAPWAQANGLSEMVLGNECELQADGTTLTTATVRADIRSMAATVKSGGYTGKVGCDVAGFDASITAWTSEGIGTLDVLGWNLYDTLAKFTTWCSNIASGFGAQAHVSEFGSLGSGYQNFNDENLFALDTISRITAMQSAGIASGYFFCYRDGHSGIAANTFALVQTNNVAHCVRGAILNTPGQQIFSSFAM